MDPVMLSCPQAFHIEDGNDHGPQHHWLVMWWLRIVMMFNSEDEAINYLERLTAMDVLRRS
jgi:hypothetical protein